MSDACARRGRVVGFALGLVVAAIPVAANPIFPNSVVSNDLPFIRPGDIGAYRCLVYEGATRAEMPDSRGGELFADGVRVFRAGFADGSSVPLWLHPDIGSRSVARDYAETVARALGELPSFMRETLDHVVIHAGDASAFAEDAGNFFVLYTRNIDKRVSTGDLPHTVFHESVHATLDQRWLQDRRWKRAQASDGGFVTEYAASRPDKEDLAESALFAWTMTMHPGRLPARVEDAVRRIMPARLALLGELFRSNPKLSDTGRERCD